MTAINSKNYAEIDAAIDELIEATEAATEAPSKRYPVALERQREANRSLRASIFAAISAACDGSKEAHILDAFLDRLGARATGAGGQQAGEDRKARIANGARRLDALLAKRSDMRPAVSEERASELIEAYRDASSHVAVARANDRGSSLDEIQNEIEAEAALRVALTGTLEIVP